MAAMSYTTWRYGAEPRDEKGSPVLTSDGVEPMPPDAYRCPRCGDWFIRAKVRHFINVPAGQCYHGDEITYVPAWETW